MYDVAGIRYETPFEFDMALQEPVFYMMQTGIRVDRERKAVLEAEYRSRWGVEQNRLNNVVGYELNANSPKQVIKCLYKDIGLPPRRRRGKYTTEENVLRSLLSYCENKVVELKTDRGRRKWLTGYLAIMGILKVRSVRKRISSYLSDVDSKGKPAPKVDPDGRMRTTLSVGGTETGRFSSSKTLWGTGCNLQTIPPELRHMFVASEGMELAEIDLNRGESWVYSHLSEDPEMMRIHLEGGDFHAETASAISDVFGERRSVEWIVEHKHDEARKLRYVGKKVNHASAYREGPLTGAESVNLEADDTGITVTVGQFKKALHRWRRKYIGIEGWWSEIERQLSVDRKLITPFGRIRVFFSQWGDDLFKEATAYVPQSTSVDYLNRGLLAVWFKLVKPGFHGLRLLHQNHDSILVEYEADKRDIVLPAIMELLWYEMEIKGHRFVIPVESTFGRNWGELVEWKAA